MSETLQQTKNYVGYIFLKICLVCKHLSGQLHEKDIGLGKSDFSATKNTFMSIF